MNRRVVLAGHYPLDALDSESKQALAGAITNSSAVAYFSGHTHDPTGLRSHPSADLTRQFPEVNFGSTLDWPMQYARLRIASYHPDQTVMTFRIVGIAESLGVGEGASRSGLCSEPWGAALSEDDLANYLHYIPKGCRGLFSCPWTAVAALFIEQRHAMYNTMASAIPAAPSESELLGFGRTVSLDSRAVRNYELCQTAQASLAESHTPSGRGADTPIQETLLSPGTWQIEIRRAP